MNQNAEPWSGFSQQPAREVDAHLEQSMVERLRELGDLARKATQFERASSEPRRDVLKVTQWWERCAAELVNRLQKSSPLTTGGTGWEPGNRLDPWDPQL
jgi:hypothetical protein